MTKCVIDMDCSKSHKQCEGKCCGPVPFDKGFIATQKPVREIKEILEVGTTKEIPVTEDLYCPFLGEDLKCTIYDKRPQVCRDFGMGEVHSSLTCAFQAPDGRIRSRQERRQIERKQQKGLNRVVSGAAERDARGLGEEML